MRERDRVRKCAEWLAACRRLGWRVEDLDDLEALWWRHHDDNGDLKLPAHSTADLHDGEVVFTPRQMDAI
jgi:hypothetical protein